jgi:alkylation response protein AidB-like acyl-CoA dehydrogenase
MAGAFAALDKVESTVDTAGPCAGPGAQGGGPMTVDRIELRAWLEANCPSEMREPPGEDDICWGGRRFVFRSEAQKLWLERCAARGLTVPTWPKEYGGAGFAREDAAILKDEMQRIHARPPLVSFGIWMLGPALLKFGSPEQKATHLPRIARGEIRWCQGYSEPGAGSDLASLRTKAEDRGDHFLVDGQKIWTSYADQADWIFCLVRTDPQAVKQKGISFLLIDMATPGVSTRPIVLILGKSPFCETFFDNVAVPKDNLVGALNRGWDVAKYLLTHEREMIAGGGSLFDIHALDREAASQAKGAPREMARELALSPFLSTSVLSASAVARAGSREQKADWLPRIARGEAIIAFALDGGVAPRCDRDHGDAHGRRLAARRRQAVCARRPCRRRDVDRRQGRE